MKARALLSQVCRRLRPKPTATFRRSSSSSSASARHATIRRARAPWHHDPWRVAVATALGAAGSYAAVHVRYADTEPLTGRTHLAVLSHAQARQRDEEDFAKYKEYNAELILSPGHGDSLRARHIALLLVRAAHHGLAIRQRHAAVPRQRITDRGLQWMDGLRWEVVVVRCHSANAMIFPGAGKIVVSSGVLLHRRGDCCHPSPRVLESRTVLEIGHVIGRHSSGVLSWLAPLVKKVPVLLYLMMFLRRRSELEADEIGLMVLAAAGVHPRVALRVQQAFGSMAPPRTLLDSLRSTHPSSRARLELLARPDVMGRALELYNLVVVLG
ncbi:hypothetical protein ACQ4PT_068480 [Festuca glaucescens]